MATQIRFQPTLILLLGTSAGKIGWRTKQLLYQAYGDVPVLRYLWVDIDNDIDSQARPWFSANERVDLSGYNPAAVVKNLDHYPTIKEWWPDARVPAGMLAGGGSPQQMRLVGRLSLFRMFNDRSRGEAFIDKLRSATEALFEIANIEATEAKSDGEKIYTVEPGCRVILVFSPCGGSGSAMSFDVAYLCRDLLYGKNPTIISMNVLPPVMDKAIRNETQTQKEKIRANAYAWFREDNELTAKPYWNVQYPEGGPVEVNAPPFDYRFIVDMENQAGYRLDSVDDVYTMIAQAIFMDTGSSIGGAMRGFTANVFALGDEFEGMRRSYSSLAAATLLYPKARLLDYCANRLAGDLITGGLLRTPEDQQVSVAAAALLSQLHLREADLVGEMMESTVIKNAYEPSILKADSVAAASTQIDAQESQNQQARRAAVDQLQRYSEKRLEELKTLLDAEICRLVATNGIMTAVGVIEKLLQPAPAGMVDPVCISLEGLKIRLTQQGCTEGDLQEARANFERSRRALKSLDDGIEDTLERMVSMKGWMRKFALFKRDCLSAMSAVNDTTVQLAAQAQIAGIYDQLSSLLDGYKTKLLSTAASFRLLAEDLSLAAKKASSKNEDRSGRYEFLQEVPVDFDLYYRENTVNIAPTNAFHGMIPTEKLNSIETLKGWASSSPKAEVIEYARSFFIERLEATSLLSTLQEMAVRQGKEPSVLVEEYLDRLVGYCHPFWRYDQDAGLSDTEGKSMIGVEDENSPLLPATYRNSPMYEIKTTGFRDRIDVVRVRHGLPAFLIRGISEWKSIYERRRKGDDPLHVLPGMEFAADLLPEQGKKNREAFAAAIAFGYIVQVGSWYYFDPGKAYLTDKISPGKEFRLAQGREKAEDTFARRDDWVRKVTDLIETEVRQAGNDATIRKLDEVIAAYKVDIARMKSSDESLRRQFEKEMKALQAMQRMLGKVG